MADDEQNAPYVVWGIAVLRKSNGSQKWPETIKQIARDRILGGQTIATVARELGTTSCVVGR